VAFGGGMFSESEKKLFKELQVCNCIRQIDGDDRLLAAYYKNASLFVYPSLYEGFGIPPLEAMNYSCPVACSHSSSIPEVVGDAGCYFDPQSVESISHSLEELAFSTSLQSTLKQRGRNRIKLFSWGKCVSEHEKLYRSLF
jgi:glycosyltransferase involved in cell wall biosynthesis